MLSLSLYASLSLSLFLHGAFTYFALPFFNRVGMSLQNVIILLCSQSFRLLPILSNQSLAHSFDLFFILCSLSPSPTLSISFFVLSISLTLFLSLSFTLFIVGINQNTNKLCNDLNSVQRW